MKGRVSEKPKMGAIQKKKGKALGLERGWRWRRGTSRKSAFTKREGKETSAKSKVESKAAACSLSWRSSFYMERKKEERGGKRSRGSVKT